MTPAEHLTQAPLIVIAALSAVILIVAWRSFGYVAHALTWSGAFALLAVAWLLRLSFDGTQATSLLVPLFGGAAVVLGTIGFRQRAQLPGWAGRLWSGWALQIGASLLLAPVAGLWAIARVPFYLQAVAMLLIAARTLTGRRRTERTAERGVQVVLAGAALWIVFRLGDALGCVRYGATTLRYAAVVLQPAMLTAVSLFVVFLIGADLADRLRRMANTDRLTGLLNRRGFEEALAAILASARRNGRSIVLAVADIDHFKDVNDRFGHPAGDAVIRAVGLCLAGNVARRDLVARVGGEEFAVVMTDVDPEVARCAAEVLRERVAGIDAGLAIRTTTSFGLAAMRLPDDTQAELLERADRALYQSKKMGRDRVTLIA